MKKAFFFILCFLILILSANAQTWKEIDAKQELAQEKRMAAASDGSIYIVSYPPHGKTKSAVLWKYDGKGLKKIYEPDYSKPHPGICIAVDKNDVPYIAFTENGEVIVKRFDGKSLVNAFQEPISAKGGVSDLQLHADRNGHILVFFRQGAKFYIKRLEGGKWVQLLEDKGMGEFHATFNSKNELFLAFKDKRLVKKLEGNILVDAAPAYYSKSVNCVNMAIDNNDVIHVVFNSFDTGEPLIVKLESNEWKQVANPAPEHTGTAMEFPALAFDSNNNMYFTCSFRSSNITVIKKMEGDKWVSFHASIPENNLKVKGFYKEFVFGNNTLFVNYPFYATRLIK